MTRCDSSYLYRMIGLALISGGLAIGVATAQRAGIVPESLRAVVALLPAVPLIWFFRGLTQWLARLDEFQRMIHLEAMVIQFVATGMLVMCYSLLAKARVVPDLPATKAFPAVWLAIFSFWSLGIVWVRRKYR